MSSSEEKSALMEARPTCGERKLTCAIPASLVVAEVADKVPIVELKKTSIPLVGV